MGTMVLIILLLISLLLAYLFTGYQILARCRRNAIQAWKQFDVVLRRRHDLALRLEGVVREGLASESVLAKAVRQAVDAGGDVAQRSAAEQVLGHGLSAISAQLDARPELREREAVQAVRAELESAQVAYQQLRDAYNTTVDVYNQARSGGLSGPLAAPFGFKPAVHFEAVD